jgi:hypothetical protein
MLAQLTVDNGVTPRALFIGIGPSLNRRVQAAFRVYANELLSVDEVDGSRVAFRHFTLETFIDAIDVAGDQNTADRLWQRYCNFQRIYDAALSVLAPRLRSEAVANASSAAAPADAGAAGTRRRTKQPSATDAASTDTTEAKVHA